MSAPLAYLLRSMLTVSFHWPYAAPDRGYASYYDRTLGCTMKSCEPSTTLQSGWVQSSSFFRGWNLHIHRSLQRTAIALYSVVLSIEEAYYVPETQPNQIPTKHLKRSTK